MKMKKSFLAGMLILGALFTGCGGAKESKVIQAKGSDTILNVT